MNNQPLSLNKFPTGLEKTTPLSKMKHPTKRAQDNYSCIHNKIPWHRGTIFAATTYRRTRRFCAKDANKSATERVQRILASPPSEGGWGACATKVSTAAAARPTQPRHRGQLNAGRNQRPVLHHQHAGVPSRGLIELRSNINSSVFNSQTDRIAQTHASQCETSTGHTRNEYTSTISSSTNEVTI